MNAFIDTPINLGPLDLSWYILNNTEKVDNAFCENLLC